jgi:hypothetical protein
MITAVFQRKGMARAAVTALMAVSLLLLAAPTGFAMPFGHMGFWGCDRAGAECPPIGGAGVIVDYRFEDALALPVGTGEARGMGLGGYRYLTDYFRMGLEGDVLDVQGPAHEGTVTMLGVTVELALRVWNVEFAAGGLFGRGKYRLQDKGTGAEVSNESFAVRGTRASIGLVLGPVLLFVGADSVPVDAAEFQGGRAIFGGVYAGRF